MYINNVYIEIKNRKLMIIREILTEEEFKQFADFIIYGYFPSPDENGVIKRIQQLTDIKKVQDLYLIALYENDKPASASGLIPLKQNVRNKIFDVGGVFDVNTYPEARRRGYVRELMKHTFNEIRNRSQTFSCLYPFKQSFYSKFGYITFPQFRNAIFKTANLYLISNYKMEGSVERDRLKEKFVEYFDFLNLIQNQIHGMSIFKQEVSKDYPTNLIPDQWVVFVKHKGNTIGMMTYKLEGIFKNMNIRDFFFITSRGKYLLLKYIYTHLDQIKEINVPVLPNDNPEYWIDDLNATIKSRDWVPSAMGRITIIENLSGMKVGKGSFSAFISDEYCDWNNGHWVFEETNGELIINKAESSECSLSIQGLSAIIYGCYDLGDFKFKNWGEISTKTESKIRRLFPKKHPFLFAEF